MCMGHYPRETKNERNRKEKMEEIKMINKINKYIINNKDSRLKGQCQLLNHSLYIKIGEQSVKCVNIIGLGTVVLLGGQAL